MVVSFVIQAYSICVSINWHYTHLFQMITMSWISASSNERYLTSPFHLYEQADFFFSIKYQKVEKKVLQTLGVPILLLILSKQTTAVQLVNDFHTFDTTVGNLTSLSTILFHIYIYR